MEGIDSRIWDIPVAGYNLRGDNFRVELRGERTLLVFLRHLG